MRILLTCAFALFVTAYACAQDLIITRDAKKIDAKVLEISETEIKYKEADYLEGPIFEIGIPKVLAIVFSSGKVKVFENNQENVAQSGTQVFQQGMTIIEPELKYLSPSILSYIHGFPKNVVFVEGNYTMLFDNEAIIFFQFNYDNAEIVEYGHNDKEINTRRGGIKEFSYYHSSDFEGVEINHLERLACDKFNSVKKKQKCTMQPSSTRSTIDNTKQYMMCFNVEKMDVGSGTISSLSLNGGTKSGGVILSGKITISDLVNKEDVCTLYVDRVKGIGSPYFNVRIVNTLEELFGKQLFLIKDVKL